MLVSGLMIWFNVLPYPPGYLASHLIPPLTYDAPLQYWHQGWPDVYLEFGVEPTDIPRWHGDRLFFNGITAMTFIITVTVACEWLIRRRSRPKLQQPSP